MRHLGTSFLRGLAAVLPVALTLYVVWLLATGAERVMGGLLEWIIPEGLYWPGMGLILAIVVVTVIGVVVRLPWMALLMGLGDALLVRIPVVKTIYSTIRDFTDFVARLQEKTEVGRPVRVRLWEEVELMGLVTDIDPEPYRDEGGAERVLVYMPMSYQIGGYTLALDKARLQPVDMSVEEALKYAVTAGIRKSEGAEAPGKG